MSALDLPLPVADATKRLHFPWSHAFREVGEAFGHALHLLEELFFGTLAHLALVALERFDLLVDVFRDVDIGIGLVGPGYKDFTHLMRLQALRLVLGVGET